MTATRALLSVLGTYKKNLLSRDAPDTVFAGYPVHPYS
jgi:hypothetical protein